MRQYVSPDIFEIPCLKFFSIPYSLLLPIVDGGAGGGTDVGRQIPGLKEDYKSLNLHINIAELVMEGSGSAEFRRRWQAERAMLEGDDCYEVQQITRFYSVHHCSHVNKGRFTCWRGRYRVVIVRWIDYNAIIH